MRPISPTSAIIGWLSAGFWLLFVASLPLSKSLSSIAEVAVLLLGLPTGLPQLKKRIADYPQTAFLMLLFGSLLVGMLYTENTAEGWRLLRHQHRFVAVPLAILLHLPWLKQNARLLLQVFCLAVSLACLITLAFYWLPEPEARALAIRLPVLPYPDVISREAFGLYSPFIDRIQFSSLIGLSILCTLYLWNLRSVVTWLLPLQLYTIFLLGGRGGQLGLLAGIACFGTFWLFQWLSTGPAFQHRNIATGLVAILMALGITAGLALAAYHTVPAFNKRIGQMRWEMEVANQPGVDEKRFEHFTTIKRFISWQNMWQVVKQQPVLGTGTGDYEQELKAVYAKNNPHLTENIHNQYLYWWGMLGIWGLLNFAGILIYWAFRLLNQGLLTAFALTVLIFYLVEMMPDAVLYMQVDNMAFSFFLGFIGILPAERSPYHA